MKNLVLILLFLTGSLLMANGQDEARLMRFPTINGDKLVFSYGGDLYTASSEGGIARKITSDVDGYEMFAKFSPDGSKIAFTAQYDGNTEVYVMDANGGVPTRVTYTPTLGRDDISDRMGPNNITMTWTPDGKNILFRSRMKSFNSFVGQLYSISIDGGMPQQVPLASGGFCSFSPDGNKLAFNQVFREFRTWKYYKGGMADDIRIYDYKTGEVTKITDNVNQDIMPMWYGDNIYYISDRDHTMNLFVYNTKTKETRKLTNFTDYDIKFPSLGDGKIVFEKGGYIYVFDLETEKATKLTIIIADDKNIGRNEMKDATKNIGSASVSPDGKRLVMCGRGDVFTLPVEEGITRNLTQSSGSHDRNAEWSPDGKWIAFISDMSGEYEIYIQKSDGSEAPQQITKKSDDYIYSLSWSPDSKKILYSNKLMELNYVDIDSKKVTRVAKSGVWEYRTFGWAPDSKWITYAENKRNGMTQIYLYNLEDAKSTAVTDEWYSSNSPSFSDDGKYLVFSSDRDFSPIYSQTEWNHAYRNMGGIFMIALAKETENPLAPKNDEVTVEEEKDEESKEDKGKEENKDEKSSDIKVDLDGISDRIIPIPLEASGYFGIRMVKDKIYYVQFHFGKKGTTLKYYDLKEKKETELGDNMNYDLTPDCKKMLIGSRGKYYVIPLPSGKITLKEPVNTDGMKVMTNLKEEWQQIFDESWRQMRDFLYAENMHGVDWKAMYKKYSVLVPHVTNRNDLNYIIGELIGELNVGHAYVNGGDKPEPTRIKTGLLGAELSRDKSGYYKIDKILKGQNWDKNLRSPLTEVGIKATEGNYIVAVDGNSVKDVVNIYQLLIGKANQVVELTLSESAGEKETWKVYIKPIDDESGLYYYEWVQNNIRLVNEATNGKVGYIHIPDMGPGGLNEFVKHFYPQITKQALIIDDRGNGGGNVSPMIIERLRREVIRMGNPRNVTIPSTVPGEMVYGPMVLLVNQYSASDGDLFPYAFKKLEMGTVIGVRTWGGIIGIRGSLPFVDGADLRKPEFGTYDVNGEWMVEGWGVEPDIVVENDPAKEFNGDDEQLKKAIEVVLEQLEDWEALPGKPADPDRSR
jgi:tricorn protease